MADWAGFGRFRRPGLHGPEYIPLGQNALVQLAGDVPEAVSGLKADLDDSFTFLSRFIGGLDPCYDDIFGRF